MLSPRPPKATGGDVDEGGDPQTGPTLLDENDDGREVEKGPTRIRGESGGESTGVSRCRAMTARESPKLATKTRE